MAATNTNIKINIVEPGSPTPVDPATGTTDISAPDTGLFTHSIGGPEATAIGVVLILTIAAIVVAILYRKQKKAGKVTKLVRTIEQTKTIIKSKKRMSAGLTALALLASAGTLTALLTNAGKSNTNAAERDGLTLDVSSEDLTIEVGDSPVFAVLPVELTVEEATPAGYTLTTYTTSTDIVSTTNPNNKIPMIAVEEDELIALEDNTWGLALDNEPASKDSKVYTILSTDQSNPTILKSIDDYSETPANDKTTIYYGFYITPDTPKGTYEGSVINYNAEPNYITNLSFNGNGNDGGVDMEGMTIIAGDTITLPENTYTKEGYNFTGWNTAADPTEQDPGEAYADQAEYTAIEGETKDVTLYAQWEEELPVIGDLIYMQDFASLSDTDKASVINSMIEGDEYQLQDNRDQTMYYIAKLADGNVWMTQNLDLDLSTEKTFTPADTNVSEGWTPTNSTISFTSAYASGWKVDNYMPYSVDPGDVYYYSSGTADYDMRYTSLADCQTTHPDCSAHNHAGNYYNWSAAVAANDTSSYTTQYENMTTSICPAGWRLPAGPNSEDNYYDDITNLLRNYNNLIEDTLQHRCSDSHYCSSYVYYHDYLPSGFNTIRTAPLWLTRPYWINYGRLDNPGRGGYYWSNTVSGSTSACSFNFESGNVYPAYRSTRSNGYSVRCVAQ